MSNKLWDCCYQEEIPIELLDLASHPTPSDLEKRLGKELTDVFLKTCTPFQKILFGRDKPLKGPFDEGKMWINPEDRLNGNKIKVSEAPYTDCLQALTHHGILEIGKKYEEKLAEFNKKAINKAVQEADDLAKFEADLRIKFHVEEETSKLNEEWQAKLEELMKIHETEKREIAQIFHDSRKLFCEFITKKHQEESKKLVEEAKEEVREEMKREYAKIIDDELAQQEKIFETSMEMTLKNLEKNDRDKMDELQNQCLKAMDIQHHLMMCRQIIELLHLMSVEKCHWERKLYEMRVKYEATISSLHAHNNPQHKEQKHLSREHQSKESIFTAALVTILNGVDDKNSLDEHEKRIFDEIQRMLNARNNDDGESRDSKIFIVKETSNVAHDALNSHRVIAESDWINRKEEADEMPCYSTSVAVQWERQDSSQIISYIDDAFMSSIFNKMSHQTSSDVHCHFDVPKIASSLMTAVKNSLHDDKLMLESISQVLYNMIGRQQEKPLESFIETVILMPETREGSLHIKDSVEFLHERKISFSNDTAGAMETHNDLLGAVDSLEILSHAYSSTHHHDHLNFERNSPPSFRSFASLSSQTPSKNENVNPTLPSYMKIPTYKCQKYEKMTEEEWMHLEDLEEKSSETESGEKRPSIHFEGEQHKNISRSESKRSSILKSSWNEATTNNLGCDALQPIRKKCLEAVSNLKVESVLRMLCEEDEEKKSEMSFE